MRRGLGHLSRVTLRVRDLEASAAFYRAVFGYRQISRYESPSGCFRLVNLARRPWGSILQLYQDMKDPQPVTHGTGYLYLVVAVHDLDSACRAVAERHGTIISRQDAPAPKSDTWHEFGRRIIATHRGRGVRLAIVTDPDGHAIELVLDRWLPQRLLLHDLLPPPLLHLLLQAYGLFRDGRRKAAASTANLTPVPQLPAACEEETSERS